MNAAVAAARGQIVWGEQVALHLVSLGGSEYARAIRVLGKPDFIHIGWDRWARLEVFPGDMAVFAAGTFDGEPSPYSYPDLYEPDEDRS